MQTAGMNLFASAKNANGNLPASIAGTNRRNTLALVGLHAAMTMQKIPFSKYTPLQQGDRSIDEAMSEIQREMDVRKRLFDRWVMEGRMSWVDAHDRLCRHMAALKFLIVLAQMLDKESDAMNNPAAAGEALLTPDELDKCATEVPA